MKVWCCFVFALINMQWLAIFIQPCTWYVSFLSTVTRKKRWEVISSPISQNVHCLAQKWEPRTLWLLSVQFPGRLATANAICVDKVIYILKYALIATVKNLLEKGKLVSLHAMDAYRRIGSTAALSLNLGTCWKRVLSLTFRPLYPRLKSSLYLLIQRFNGKVNWHQNRYGC
jgi:hypothetical protein